jgi:multidrug efflux pump subunit AcrB
MMTLGGLALAIGILVDEATVIIENIHTHLSNGEPLKRAVLNASRETFGPRLLAMLSILAVFLPAFFMVGVARSLFIPLSLAVGFAMFGSFVLSNTLVPVLATRLLRQPPSRESHRVLDRLHAAHESLMRSVLSWRWAVIVSYLVVTVGGVWLLVPRLGTDLFPTVDTGQFVLRLRAPTGTRVERTEDIALKALAAIRAEAGAENVEISLMFVGNPTSNYPINSIYLWSSGPHEALITVALRPKSGVRLSDLEERLRRRLPQVVPATTVSFEAGDVVSQIMNFGAPTPIEVAVSGPDLAADRAFATKVLTEMSKIPVLRDLQFGVPLDYPTVDVRIDRERAGQLGVTVEQVGRSLAAATSSSRYVVPTYWRDPGTGIAYQVQVEVPQSRVASTDDLATTPVMPAGQLRPLLEDVAQVGFGNMPGEFDRYNQRRMLTITANTTGADLGNAARLVRSAIGRAGPPPRGVVVNVRGQVTPMEDTLAGLQTGLVVAIIAIFLLMVGSFLSVRLGVVVLSAVPAVIVGVALALMATRTTLNVQSYMGAIMATGVSVANAILLVTFAEQARRNGGDADSAGIAGARVRMRPILMTSFAMIAGMLPMALALGEGGDQTAPLARAVIGGLIASTGAVLIVLPLVFGSAQRHASRGSGSQHPDDEIAPA